MYFECRIKVKTMTMCPMEIDHLHCQVMHCEQTGKFAERKVEQDWQIICQMQCYNTFAYGKEPIHNLCFTCAMHNCVQ